MDTHDKGDLRNLPVVQSIAFSVFISLTTIINKQSMSFKASKCAIVCLHIATLIYDLVIVKTRGIQRTQSALGLGRMSTSMRQATRLRTCAVLVVLMSIAGRPCGSQVVFLSQDNYPAFLYINPGAGAVSVDNRPVTSGAMQLTIHQPTNPVG
ncbi:uncharacterized protein LOC122260905 [Penaeus japonicus]|uniref:uncharacterized protein LOC122260905 n=1 Tax=Penaeus japonicus TaxID=27405 RepID=UPI001C7121E4|nr:uncharacterized protein LOC122260905 [Penaeus japonicus]